MINRPGIPRMRIDFFLAFIRIQSLSFLYATAATTTRLTTTPTTVHTRHKRTLVNEFMTTATAIYVRSKF